METKKRKFANDGDLDYYMKKKIMGKSYIIFKKEKKFMKIILLLILKLKDKMI